jgi:DnaJ homologue, subfamily C, member 28, conserved domain
MFDRIAEKAIADAIREGKFDNLPNAGRPLDLEDYFKAPEDMRMAYGLLKSANVLPEEVELMNEIGRLDRTMAAESDDIAREALRLKIERCRLKLALQIAQRRRAR